MRAVLRAADRVVVHSQHEAALATDLRARVVLPLRLPFSPPDGLRIGPHKAGSQRTGMLGFLGFVRHYKGLDLLLEAIARSTSKPRLVVRGEFWEPVEKYLEIANRAGISERVRIFPGYASAGEISDMLGEVDALVLPYRSVTGTQQSRLAFACGVPVIATDVGSLRTEFRANVDGLLAPATVQGLKSAIDHFYSDGRWLRLRQNVRVPDAEGEWDRYVTGIIGK